MKISSELAKVLTEASKEVDGWPKWKRSTDPIGDKVGTKEELKTSTEPNSIKNTNAA
jgi:hypothetical protein